MLRRTPLHPQWLLGAQSVMALRLESIAGGRVLDIGCADRWVERRLRPSCEYIGLDYLATGKEMYGAHPDLFADASRLPLQGASVDTVVLLEVLEHLRDPRDALHEIARVLQPQGQLLLTMPFLYPIHDAPHDYQRYTIHGLTREIEAVGLRVDEVKPSLGSAETAGLIACLALGGMALKAMQRRSAAMLFIPLMAVAVPIVNVVAWLGGQLLPSWTAISVGYLLTAHKP